MAVGQLDVTSPANPRVKWLASLRRRRVRDDERATVVEGFAELELALQCGVRPHLVVVCPDLAGPDWATLIEPVRPLGSEVLTMSRPAFAKASYRESPDGWLAVVADPAGGLDRLDTVLERSATDGRAPLILVCEAVEKPGNLGAMLRTAEAAGVDAVVAASPVADWGNPNVVRASKGTVFAVPIASAPAMKVAGWLREHGLCVVVATPEADVVVSDLDLTGPTAVVVGAEHAGLSSLWYDADVVGPQVVAAALPMAGQVNSLNVATAAAIVLYEAVRQRRP